MTDAIRAQRFAAGKTVLDAVDGDAGIGSSMPWPTSLRSLLTRSSLTASAIFTRGRSWSLNSVNS